MSAFPPLSTKLRDDMKALLADVDASARHRQTENADRLAAAERRERDQVADLRSHHRAANAMADAEQHQRSDRAVAALRHELESIPGALGVVARTFDFGLLDVPPQGVAIGIAKGAPVLIPLFGARGLVLRGDKEHATAFAEALFGRIVASVPLSSLRLTVFDPQVRGILGAFAELRDHAQRGSFPRAFVNEYDFQKRLEQLTDSMTVMAEQLRVAGAGSIADIWRQATPAPVLDVLVVDLVPGSLRERAALDRVAHRGAALGLLAVRIAQTEDVLDGAEGQATTITFDDRGNATLHLADAELPFTPLPPLDAGNAREVVAASIREATSSAGPVVPAERLLPAATNVSSAHGIEVVIGERHDGKPLTVGLRGQNPPTPNALIGGAVGQGKSNLLLALIYAIAAKYPPQEVEMLLLDFKEGLEFQRFAGDSAEGWLPHAKVVALESDRQFGVATLRHISRLRSERSSLFKSVGVANYDAYRAAGHELPRVVVVVDEFQVLFDGEDELASSSVQLLDQIVRQGRVAGIHIVLATQTLSGIRSLATRLDGILAQVSTRISLWNPESESQTILSPGNRAAAKLRFRGEVVVNSGGGQNPDENIVGMSTYAEAAFTARLQRRLWEEHAGTARPHVFIGTSFAEPPMHARDAGPLRCVQLGAAVDVFGTSVAHVFGSDPMNALAVVGSDVTVREQLVRSSIESAFLGGAYRRVVVVGGRELLDWSRGALATLTTQHAQLAQPELTTVDVADAARWLFEFESTLRGSGTLVVFSDLQRAPGLSEAVLANPDDPFSEQISAQLILQRLATGHSADCDLVVSAQSFASLDQVFGYARDGSGGVGGYALAEVPLAELRQLLGYNAEAPQGEPRFVYVRAGATEAAVAVPYRLFVERPLVEPGVRT